MNRNNFLSAVDFTRLLVNRLKTYWYLIIISAVIGGVLLFIYASNSPVTYTSQATIFSLTSTDDNPATSSALSLLLGSDATKSFSNESSINIVELAQSRAISEAVAAIRVSSMGNKPIATLVIEDNNAHRGFMQSKISPPQNMDSLIILGSTYLRAGLSASINRNNSFILNYTGKSENLVRVISYGFIDKISQFYIDTKREKAKRDYEFASGKVDSLKKVMGTKDYTLIAMDKRTLFTNTDKMEYRVPTENVEQEKQLIRNQYSQAVINQQTAAYKLQRDTPVIKVLDKPEPPFNANSKSVILYTFIGLLLGATGMGALVTGRLFLRYTRQEISRALFGSGPSATATTTTQAL